jgi:crotonobetainyl-CoA:carnitine CoA-transferase CaiB-like acyl-CoA transferase
VIKIERPHSGDLCRDLYLSDTDIAGDSTLFHAINRNKESLAVDLKDPGQLAELRRLVARADVIIQNFRPGVIERLGWATKTSRRSIPAWSMPASRPAVPAPGPSCRARICSPRRARA